MFLDEITFNENDTNSLFGEVSVEKEQFCEGVDGLFEIALESEMSWNNIAMSTIKEEFIAIKNESAILMEEAKENWFTKVLAWVKAKAAKVAEFFRGIFNTLMVNITNVDRFAKKYLPVMKTVTDAQLSGVEVDVYSWKDSTMVNTINSIIGKLMKVTSGSMDEICQSAVGSSYKDASKHITSKVRSAEKGKVSVTASLAKSEFGNLTKFKANVSALKTTQKYNNTTLSYLEKRAKIGMSNSADTARLKSEIETIKNIHSLTEKITGIGISLMNQKLRDAIAISRAAISATKKKVKAESASLFEII